MTKIMQKLRERARSGGSDGNSPTGTGPAAAAEGFVAEPNAEAAALETAPLHPTTRELDLRRVDSALITLHNRHAPISEQYRSLRARLLNMNPDQQHQLILITSSMPQEGKSVTTVNLGVALATGQELSVVIGDADFRGASVARMLGLEPRPGLAELIHGTAGLNDVLQPTHLPNLKVVAAGGEDQEDYAALVGCAGARTALQALRERFDYVLLDTPPVNTVSDVSMLAPHCDGIILVVEMQRTPEPTVHEAVRTLQTTNVKLLGCVLSRVPRQPGQYYERYYNYYNYYRRDA